LDSALSLGFGITNPERAKRVESDRDEN